MATQNNNININVSTKGAKRSINEVKALNSALERTGDKSKKASGEAVSLTRSTTRLGQASASAGRQFGAQASGLGGLVSAYAGAAATVFALQQAFSALNRAAQAETVIRGTQNLASAIGESGNKIISSLQQITQSQLTMVEAAEKANLALASGFNTRQIEELGEVALKSSKALGRNLGDAFERLVRGAAKLEPELLDELGIFTRIEPAAAAYAKQLGKTAAELTQFERRQAFVNEVIAEGQRKFSAINTSVPSAQKSLEQLATVISDLGIRFGGFIANQLTPLINFFANDMTNAIGLFSLALLQVSRVGMRELESSMDGAIKGIKNFTNSKLKSASESESLAKALGSLNKQTQDMEYFNYRGSKAMREQASAMYQLGRAGGITQENLDEYRKTMEQQRVAAVKSNVAAKAQLAALQAQGTSARNYNKRLNDLNKTIAATDAAQSNLKNRVELADAAIKKQALSIRALTVSANVAKVAVAGLAAVTRGFFAIFNVGLVITALLPLLKQIPIIGELIDKAFTKIVETVTGLIKSNKELTLGLRGFIASSDEISNITDKYRAMGLSAKDAATAQEGFISILKEIKPVRAATTELGNSMFGFESSLKGANSTVAAATIGMVALGGAIMAISGTMVGAIGLLIALGSAFDTLVLGGEGFMNNLVESTAALLGFGKQASKQEIALTNVGNALNTLNKELENTDSFEERLKLQYQIEMLEAFESAIYDTTYAEIQFAGEMANLTGINADVVVDQLTGSFDGLKSSLDGVIVGAVNAAGELKALEGFAGDLSQSYFGFNTVLGRATESMYGLGVPVKQVISDYQALINAQDNLTSALSNVDDQLATLDSQIRNTAARLRELDPDSGAAERVNRRLEGLIDERYRLEQVRTGVEEYIETRENEINVLKELGAEYDSNATKFDKLLKTFRNSIKRTSDLKLEGIFDGATLSTNNFQKALNRVETVVENIDINRLNTYREIFGNLYDMDATETFAELEAQIVASEAALGKQIITGETARKTIKDLVLEESQLSESIKMVADEVIKAIPQIEALTRQTDKYTDSLKLQQATLTRTNTANLIKEELNVRKALFDLRQEESELNNKLIAATEKSRIAVVDGMRNEITNRQNILDVREKNITAQQKENELLRERNRIGLEAAKSNFEALIGDTDLSLGISEDADKLLKSIISRDFEIALNVQELEDIDLKIADLAKIKKIEDQRTSNARELIELEYDNNKLVLEEQKRLALQSIENDKNNLTERSNQIVQEALIRDLQLQNQKDTINAQTEQKKLEAKSTLLKLQDTKSFIKASGEFISGFVESGNAYLNGQEQVFQNFLTAFASIVSQIDPERSVSAPTLATTSRLDIDVRGEKLSQILGDLDSSIATMSEAVRDGGTLDSLARKQIGNLEKIEEKRATIDSETLKSIGTQIAQLTQIGFQTEDAYDTQIANLNSQIAKQRELQSAEDAASQAEYDNTIQALENRKLELELLNQQNRQLQVRDAIGAAGALAGGLKSLMLGDKQDVLAEAEENYIEKLDEHKDALARVEEARQAEAEALKTSVELLKSRRDLEMEIAGIFSQGIAGASDYFNLQQQYIDNLGTTGVAGSALKTAKDERILADRELLDAESSLTVASYNLKNAYDDLNDTQNSLIYKILETAESVGQLAVSLNQVSNVESAFGLQASGSGAGAIGKLFGEMMGLEKVGAYFSGLEQTQASLNPAIGIPTNQENSFFNRLGANLEASNNSVVSTFGAGLNKVTASLGLISKNLNNFFQGMNIAQKFFPDAKPTETGILGGIGGVLGGTFGATTGAALGQSLFGTIGAGIAGPIGAALGAALGGLGGGALSKIFFGKKSNKTGTGTVDFATGDVTEGGMTGKKYSAENRAAAMGVARFAKDLNSAIETLTEAKTALTFLKVGVGSRDPATIQTNLDNFTFNPRDAEGTGKQLFRALIRGIEKNVNNRDIRDAIKRLDFGDSIQENLEKLEFAKNFRSLLRPFEVFADGIVTLEEQLNDFTGSLFNSTKETAEGLTTEILNLLDRTKEVFGPASSQVREFSGHMVNMLLANIDLNVAADGRVRLLTNEAETMNNMALIFASVETETRAFRDSLLRLGVSAGEADRIIEEGIQLRLREVADEFEKSVDRALLLAKGLDTSVLAKYEEVLSYQNAIVDDARTITEELGGYTDLVVKAEEAVMLQRLEMIASANDEQLRALRELTRAGGDFSNAFVKAAVDAEIAARKISSIFEAQANLRAAERSSRNVRRGMASGGIVEGGVPNKDSVPALLMPGEFVINEKAAKAIGYDTLYGMNSGNVRRMQVGGAAGGGVTGAAQPFAPTRLPSIQPTPITVANVNELSNSISVGIGKPIGEVTDAINELPHVGFPDNRGPGFEDKFDPIDIPAVGAPAPGDGQASVTEPRYIEIGNGATVNIPTNLFDRFAPYGADTDLILSFEEAAAIVSDANSDLFREYRDLVGGGTSVFSQEFDGVLENLTKGDIIMARALFEMSTGLRSASDELDAYNQVVSESRSNQLLNIAGIVQGRDEVRSLTDELNNFYYATQTSQTEYIDLYKVTNELNKLLAQEVITSEEYASALNSVNSAYETSIQAIQEYTQFFVELKDSLDVTGAQANIRNLVYYFEDATKTIEYAVQDGFLNTVEAAQKQIQLQEVYNNRRLELIEDSNEEQLKAIRDSQDAIVDVTYKAAASAELLSRQLQAASKSFGSFETSLVDFYNSILPAGESLYNGLKRSLEAILNEADIVFQEVSTNFIGTIGTFVTLAQNGQAGISNLRDAIEQLNYQLVEAESIDIETYQTGISLLSSSFNDFIDEFNNLRNALTEAEANMDSFRASLLDATRDISNDVKSLFSEMVSNYRSGLQNLQNMYTQALQGQASAEEQLYNTLFSAQQAFANAGGDLSGHISIIKNIIEGPDGYGGLTTYLESLRLDIENGIASIGQIDTQSSIEELQEQLQNRLDRLTALQALPDSADKFVRISRILSEITDIESQLSSATNASDALKNAALDLVDVELELNKNNLDAKYTNVNLTLTDLADNLVTQAQEARKLFNEANEVVAGIVQALADADASGFTLALEGLNTSTDTVAEFTSQLDALNTEFDNIQTAAQMIKDAGFADVLDDFINVADPNRITSLTQAAEQAFGELQERLSDYEELVKAKDAYEALYGSIEATNAVLPIDQFNELNSELQGVKDRLTQLLPTIGATSFEDLDSSFQQFIKDAISLLSSPITLDVSAQVQTAVLGTQTIQGTESGALTTINTGMAQTNALLYNILTQGLGAASPGWLYYILLTLEDMRQIMADQLVILGGVQQTFESRAELVSEGTAVNTVAPVTGGGLGTGGGLSGQFFSVADPISKPADYFYIVTPKYISADEIFIFTQIPITDVIEFLPTTLFGLDQEGKPGAFILETSTITFDDFLTIDKLTKTIDDFIEIELVDHTWSNWWNSAILQDHAWRDWWNDPIRQDHTWANWWNPATLLDHDVYDWFEPNKMTEHDIYTWFNAISQVDTVVTDWFAIKTIDVNAYDFFDVDTPVQLSDYVEQKSINYSTFFNILEKEVAFSDWFTITSSAFTLLDWITVQKIEQTLTDWVDIVKEELEAADLIDIAKTTLYGSDLYDIQSQSLSSSSFYTVNAQKLAAGNFFTIDTDNKIQLTLEDIVVSDPIVADPKALELSDIFNNYDAGFTFPKYALGVEDIIDVVTLDANGLENKHTLEISDVINNIEGGELKLEDKADLTFQSLFKDIEKKNFITEDFFTLSLTDKIERDPDQVFKLSENKYEVSSDQLISIKKTLKPASDFYIITPKTMKAEDLINFSYLEENPYKAQAESVLSVSGSKIVLASNVINVTGTKNIDANVLLKLSKSDVAGNKLFTPTASDISGNVFWKVKQSEITGSALFSLAPEPKIGVTAYDIFEISQKVPIDVSGTFESDIKFVGDKLSNLTAQNRAGFSDNKGQLIQIKNNIAKIATDINDTFFKYYQDTFLKSYYDQYLTLFKSLDLVVKRADATLTKTYTDFLVKLTSMDGYLKNIANYTNSIKNTLASMKVTLEGIKAILTTIDQDTSYMRPDIEEIRQYTKTSSERLAYLKTISDTLERMEDRDKIRNNRLTNIEASTANLVKINRVRYVYDDYRSLNVPGFATGGEVKGLGTGTSDSIPANLSNGEFVIKASSARQLGLPILNALNSTGDVGYLGNFGRNGDNMVAHITGSEANLLQMMGGSGTRNPMTGLKEFFFDGRGDKMSKTLYNLLSSIDYNFKRSWSRGDGYPEWMSSRGENRSYYGNNDYAKIAFSEAVRYANLAKYGQNVYNLRGRNWVIDWDNWSPSINTWHAPWGSRRFYYNDSKAMVDAVYNSFANGGYVSGPGTGMSDSINAMLSNGEYVVRKSAVDKVGVDALDYMNSTGNVPGNVEINITNNGQPVDVEGQPTMTVKDGKVVVDVVLKDLRTNGPIARSMKKMR